MDAFKLSQFLSDYDKPFGRFVDYLQSSVVFIRSMINKYKCEAAGRESVDTRGVQGRPLVCFKIFQWLMANVAVYLFN